MKKLLSLILLMALLMPVVGFAEQDLASMTDEELVLLNQHIAAELLSRGKTALLPYGEYIIGETIPEGYYLFVWDESYKNNPMYWVYENSDKNDAIVWESIGKLPQSSDRVYLKKGNLLQIDYSHVYIMKSAPIVIEFK